MTQKALNNGKDKKQLLTSLIMLGLMVPGVSLSMNGSFFASASAPLPSSPLAISSSTVALTVNTVDMGGAPLTGFYVVLYQMGVPISSGYSPVSFTLVSGASYVVESDGYGACVFDHWQDTGSTNNQRSISLSSDTTITSVLNCSSAVTTTTTTVSTTTTVTSTSTTSTSVSGGITVSAHRVPASYWDPCFATTCTNPYASCNTSCTGPGATMYFALYDSAGNFVAAGYADEHGYTFTGLTQGATYYVYPDDCNMCHGSLHNVVFQHWGDGSTVRPIAATVGQSLDAWYSCTNQCAGG